MEDMGIVEEWERSIVAENTRKHHTRLAVLCSSSLSIPRAVCSLDSTLTLYVNT